MNDSPDPLLHAAFRHCPRCGSRQPEIHQNRKLHCPRCGFLFFFNTAAAAAAFIFIGEELLLCVRAHEPAQGMLDLPGGFIEPDESIESGLRREIAEELSINVANFQYLTSAPNRYRYADIPYKTADVFFTCTALDPERLQPGDDVREVLRVKPAAVAIDSLAFPSARAAFRVLRRRGE